MGLNKKPYIEQDKQTAEKKLAARVELLQSRGMDKVGIRREATVKKLTADIRKARQRLGAIAAQEKLAQSLVEMKAQKAEAEKAAKEAPQSKQPKAKKAEKEKAPAKKAKKEKKESAAQ